MEREKVSVHQLQQIELAVISLNQNATEFPEAMMQL